jgi:galactose-1-phosphate uridylyltransferase
VFKNHGASAGASMAHSHSQMLGTPFVPPSVTTRLSYMKEVFERMGHCSLCEMKSKDTLISETPNFSAIVPFAASYPFEIWIIPQQHISHFHEIDQNKVWAVLNQFNWFSLLKYAHIYAYYNLYMFIMLSLVIFVVFLHITVDLDRKII